jgi:molecular chaperone DnaK
VKEASRDKTKLQLEIKYEATSVETKEWINIKVLREKTTGTIPDVIYADVVRGDDAWSSGKTQIGKKAALMEVLLQEGRSNSFTVNVYDEQGNKLECQPNQFSILQGIGDLDRMSVLPYNIGIGKWFETEEKDLFQPVSGLEKNKRLPATGVINGLKTRSTIRQGIAEDIILIPIYQGDYNAEGTNPVFNNWITDVIISGENLPALLPEGSEVNITIKVDRSEQMQFSAYFPLIDHTRKLKIQIKQTEPPTEKHLTTEIAKAKQSAHSVNATNILEKLNILEQQLKNERGSADGKMKILNSLRKELLKLDGAEKTAAWPKLEQELKAVLLELEDLIIQINENGDSSYFNMSKIETEYQEYKKKTELIIKEKNQKEARELIGEIGNDKSILLIYLLPERFIQSFNIQFNIINWKDSDKAKDLINHGFVNARSNYDRRKLADIIFAIYQEMKNPNEFKTDTLK